MSVIISPYLSVCAMFVVKDITIKAALMPMLIATQVSSQTLVWNVAKDLLMCQTCINIRGFVALQQSLSLTLFAKGHWSLPVTLKNIMKGHNTLKLYKCCICVKEYSHWSSFYKHRKSHSTEWTLTKAATIMVFLEKSDKNVP